MAIAQSDGSIILSTKVDTKGVKSGISSIKSAVGKLGTAIGIAFSVKAIVNFSREAGKLATQQEASAQRLIDIYGESSQAIGDFIDSNARAIGMSRNAAASFASVYGNLFSVWADQKTNAELTQQYLNMTAVVASKTGRTVEDVQERVRSGLLGNTEAIEDLGVFVNVKTIEMTDAFKRMADGKSWEKLDAYTQQQIRTMAILEQATDKYGTQVSNTTALVRARYTAAYEDFKQTWGQLINVVLMPVLKVATLIFDVLTAALRAMSGITGKTVEGFQQTATNTKETAENIDEQVTGQKELNKELKKSLAGFDDLMILKDKSSESDSTSAGSGNILQIPTTKTGTQDTSKFNEMKGAIISSLADILKAASGALLAVGLIALFSGAIPLGIGLIAAGAAAYAAGTALSSDNPAETLKGYLKTIEENLVPALLGIGVLLLFFGAIPLGIGLILGGIVYWGYKEVTSEEYDTASFEEKLNVIMEAVSLGLVAIGVLLIFFGHVPLGIGLIIAGKSLLSATEAKLDESKTPTAIQKFVDENSALIVGVSLALIVIALILFATGVGTPLALGLLMAGGATLAATSEIKKEEIPKLLENFFAENARLIVGISLVLVGIGIILLATGVGVPLGLGLIMAGGAALATEAVINWDYIKEKAIGTFEAISKWVSTYGGLVLGILLVFSGVGAPLGLALIMDSVRSQGKGEQPLLWDSILNSIKQTWENIKTYWNENIANIWTLDFWLGLAKVAGNGLTKGFELAINGVISMFENMVNFVIKAINKISFDVPDWLGGGHFGFNLSPVKIDRIKIPRLAQGAVIPPNREFLAVLGDQKRGMNIEAPLDTIVEAFNIALANNGGGNSGDTTVVIEIDGREFGHAVIKQGQREAKRLGTRLVMA